MTKMTYAQALEIAIAEMQNEDAKAKLEALKAQTQKKAASKGARKPSKTQIANEAHKAVIVEAMKAEPNRLFTITEMVKEFPFSEELSNQRVSAIVTQLKKADVVVRTEEKGKAYFKLA